MEKLKRLHALSTDPTGNVHELEVAAATLTRLCLEHGIELAEIEAPQDAFTFDYLDRDAAREEWHYILLQGLAEANCCEGLQDNLKGKFALIGPAEQCRAIRYIYEMCCREIGRHWDAHVIKSGVARSFLFPGWEPPASSAAQRNSFHFGAAEAIATKALQAKRQLRAEAAARGSERALVHVDSQIDKISDWIEDRTGEKAHVKDMSTPVDRSSFMAGQRAGALIDLEAERSRKLGQHKARLQPEGA